MMQAFLYIFTLIKHSFFDVSWWLTVGAIMFGDSLLPSECCLIIEELKATSLCFQVRRLLNPWSLSLLLLCGTVTEINFTVLQCAHGRPTTVPILNVTSLHEELARLQMLSGTQAETWHGLGHHEPSLERAQMRLEQLRKLRRGL
jgi:DNA mismatch repair protein MLH3